MNQVILRAVGPDVIPKAVQTGRLPPWMQRKLRRSSLPILLLALQSQAGTYRRHSQGCAYRGLAEVTPTSSGLHDGELDVLRQPITTTLLHESLRDVVGEAAAARDDLVRRVEHPLHPPDPASRSRQR